MHFCLIEKKSLEKLPIEFVSSLILPQIGFLFDDPCKNRWNFIETLVQI